MNEELAQAAMDRLDALAAKMGTTIETLYPILVQETSSQGLALVLLAAALLLVAVVCGTVALLSSLPGRQLGLTVAAVMLTVMAVPTATAGIGKWIAPNKAVLSGVFGR